MLCLFRRCFQSTIPLPFCCQSFQCFEPARRNASFENNPEGLNEYLGEVNVTELSGGGAVDHLAFRASGSKDLIDRLKILKVPYRERVVEEMNLFQLFVEDPNNITLELNYWDD